MIRHAHGGDPPDEVKRVLYRNWNLDSDRGYAYQAWQGTVPHAEPFAMEDETYIPE